MKHDLSSRSGERGFAILSVLFVLIALLILCAPFLLTARNASRASSQLADRVQGRLALDAAERHTRHELQRSHPSVDSTIYYDSLEELTVDPRLPSDVWNTADANGVMWDLESRDVAGLIDVNSAPPQLFGNLFGFSTRLTQPVKAEDKELVVASTAGFDPVGFLWIDRELIGYRKIDGSSFKDLVRGLTGGQDAEGNPMECGPSVAVEHARGAIVLDQRAFAPALWRILDVNGLRSYDTIERVNEASSLALAGSLGLGATEALERWCTPYAAVCAGRTWQRPVRLANALEANKSCKLQLDETRWLNPGATVMITDGQSTEYHVVQSIDDNGAVHLYDFVTQDYSPYTAEVRVLARRPVNINVAPPEVIELLLTNLQLNKRNSRITREEAHALAALIVESRPFTGHEDFLRRVVLPSAGVEKLPSDAEVVPSALAQGSTLIDVEDAVALYANALNANDVQLAYSTLPFCYTSRDVYDMELRTSVNAESGAERVSGVRNVVDLFVPQEELLHVWARQEDFDEALRLDLEAPWWASGPSSTSTWDNGASPPSRLWANWGTYQGQIWIPGITKLPATATPGEAPTAEHVFASRDDTAWAQLWASRTDEMGQRAGRAMHFDHETRDLEGRFLPDEPITAAPDDKRILWTSNTAGQPGQASLCRALNLSMWIKPREMIPGTLLDVGRTSLDTDRITMFIDDNDLVLRVLDGVGDHIGTTMKEAGEARFALAPGNGPGIALDTWTHVQVDVRGNRPDQITMLVDGRDFGVRTPGMTRLTSSLSPSSIVMGIEDSEGFPDQGVLRIGDELIEYIKSGPGSKFLQLDHKTTGTNAGFGGRLAREPFLISTQTPYPGQNVAQNKNTTHQAQTPVMLYGYSLPIASAVNVGSGVLQSGIGRFAVAVVKAQNGVCLDGGSAGPGEAVSVTGLTNSIQLGVGLENSQHVTGLVLEPTTAGEDVMSAFSQTGGYAALIQAEAVPPIGYTTLSAKGGILFGTEIVRYTGWSGSTLFLSPTGRAAIDGTTAASKGHAFVANWTVAIATGNTTIDPNEHLEWRLWVVPVSIPVGNSQAFLQPQPDPAVSGDVLSEFAQITRLDAASDQTEWVRYDRIDTGVGGAQLVRNNANALIDLGAALTHKRTGDAQNPGPPPPPPAPPDGGSGGPPEQPPASPLPPEPSMSQGYGPEQWLPYLGVAEDDGSPVTRAARSAFQFRGVLGTFSHPHPVNTVVLPVWRTFFSSVDGGRPGRHDAAFLVDADPTDLGVAVRIQRAYATTTGGAPTSYTIHAWQEAQNALQAQQAPDAAPAPEVGFAFNHIYVALEQPNPVPIGPGSVGGTTTPTMETRAIARLTLFPSGERPRLVDRVIVGDTLNGGATPRVVVDELVFGSTRFGEGTPQGEAIQGANIVLLQDLPSGTTTTTVAPKTVRAARGVYTDAKNFLSDLPKDAGLIRWGSEIVCYDNIDLPTGTVTIAQGGRALLGTHEENHAAGECGAFLQHHTVSVLAGQINAGSSSIPIKDVDEFPPQGTVLIDQELIHYTRIQGNSLEMPRASAKPGKMDREGDGLFRGRFGTTPIAHGSGAPVILFPFRYWDRWADRADAPELAYFCFELDQPNAFWQSMFWIDEAPGSGAVKLEVLQRTDPATPWDEDPTAKKGLTLFSQGMPGGKPNSIGAQRDRVEWRVFARFAPNAFDAVTGLSHGWKETPRLKVMGVQYLGPNLTLRRVDR